MSVYGIPDRIVGRMLSLGDAARARGGMSAFASRVISNPVTGQKVSKVPRADRSWQLEVLAYRRVVGELHYATDFMASCMSRLTLMPAIRTRDGKIAAAYDDDGKPLHPSIETAADLIADLKAPTGGQSQLLRTGGGHLFSVGESFLVSEDTEDGERRFGMYSVAEYEPPKDGNGTGKIKAGAGSGAGRALPDDALVVRIWQPDLEWSQQADSSIRACIDVLERLALLSRAVRSVLMSRLANTGVYWIADEIDFPEKEDAPPESEGIDPLTADMVEAFMKPIADRSSASAVVPYIARAPHKYISEGGIRYDDLGKSLSAFPAAELRREAVLEFAQGVNLPLEIVTGQGSVNHWSAFQIDESLFKSHVEPAADTFADGITGGYLHVLMEAEGAEREIIVDGPDGQRIEGTVVCHYDSTELVSFPNRSADADDAHDRMTISDAAHRRYKGFAESDAPDEAEIDERIRRRGRSAAPASETPDGANPGPPEGVSASAVLRRRVADAAEPYIARSIERAGAKLRSKSNGQVALREALNGATNRYVAATLGPNRVASLLQGQGRECDLLVGEFAPLGAWVADHAAGAGFDGTVIARRVVEHVESLALSRLYDPDRRVDPVDFIHAIPEPA